ncbi:MAG: hypothetical protein MI745_14495 [Pseudomonadales bacterium]|nr:hypothetical protein [Pseudomonadales bacterium]
MKNACLWGLLMVLAGCGGSGGGTATAPGPSSPGEVPADPRCLTDNEGPNWQALAEVDCPRLSHYQLFSDDRNPRVDPAGPGVKFAPASGLFSDHARKYRFLFLPDNRSAHYREKAGLVFPVGTVLAKTFALPVSAGGNEDRLIETRLLIHRETGWVGLPYVWEGSDARLSRIGKVLDTYVMVDGVQQDFRYQVPDVLACRKCHQGRVEGERMTPLGTTVRQLNHVLEYADGSRNQIAHWQSLGLLTAVPDPAEWPRAVRWQDSREPLNLRAKSYLDANCSHCHSDVGSGALSGLRLEYWRDENSYTYGICNRAQGYYGGEYSLTFDIVPGDADSSVLPYRLASERATHNAKDMMPPLGRSLADHAAVALIRQWINAMAPQDCASLDSAE